MKDPGKKRRTVGTIWNCWFAAAPGFASHSPMCLPAATVPPMTSSTLPCAPAERMNPCSTTHCWFAPPFLSHT